METICRQDEGAQSGHQYNLPLISLSWRIGVGEFAFTLIDRIGGFRIVDVGVNRD